MTCQMCGAEFIRRSMRGPSPKWCSAACAHRALRRRENPDRFAERQCACGKSFMPVKNSQSCSEKCMKRSHYLRNKLRLDEYRKQWAKGNHDKQNSYRRKCHEASPELYREMRRRNENVRRARIAGSAAHFVQAEWDALLLRTGNRCLRCGVSGTSTRLTVDHIIPIALGGSNGIDNIQPLCKPCNSAKWVTDRDYRPMQQAALRYIGQ